MLHGRVQSQLLRHARGRELRVPLSTQVPSDTIDIGATLPDFRNRLLAFIARRVPDRDSAEDVLQDVMLRIHLHAAEIEHSAAVGAWMHQIARNAIADHYRRAAVRRERPAGVQLDRLEAPPPAPESDELRSELSACLRPLAERLAPPYREAIVLTELDGLTQTAAAARLGMSVSGMKSRVQRGRTQLRDLLVGCCEIELDRRGAITSYEPRENACGCGEGAGSSGRPSGSCGP